ncbi:DHS-like NAD/FAD-binding domain-containing protein [Auriculariales sp. MPI-PUGE-AT-0066]|nr:DHS-like NAD/FAD-binding domain-containing protein [Auriculariales sp. MPI-PUGE-AT-0066]
MPRKPPADDITSFQQVLSSAENIIAVCGAGLSAASGIPTFRGAGGLWRKYKSTSLATPEAFEANTSRVWQFYHYRRESALKAHPNAAHVVLGLLTQASTRAKYAPKAKSFKIITQNVDGFLLASMHYSQTRRGAGNLIEMHGRIHETTCLSCGDTRFNTASPLCPALGGTELNFDAQSDVQPEVDIPLNELPRCDKTVVVDSSVRVCLVWRRYPRLNELDDIVSKADLCLVIGTSSTVSPASHYAYDVECRGGNVAVFNLERTRGDREADFLFIGGCEEMLPRAIGIEQELKSRRCVREGVRTAVLGLV